MAKTNLLTKNVQYFFQVFLPSERGLSTHTIKSYRDTIKLFLSFLAQKDHSKIESLNLEDLTAKNVLKFLDWVETNRKNSIRTRNHRLAVLKTFFSFLINFDIVRADQYEKVSQIKSKKEAYQPIEYLLEEEIAAMLNAANGKNHQNKRDYAILLFMYNTGARAQEVCLLKMKDLRLEKPHYVNIFGKGQKTRQVPLWKDTVVAIRNYLDDRHLIDDESYLFTSKRKEALTRFGIRYLVKTYVKKAEKSCVGLKKKNVGPHTIRHTTAMHLLQSGVEINVIKAWLGHVDLNTTHGYVEINLKMKTDALVKIKKPKQTNGFKEMILKEKNIFKWLEAI